MAEGSVVGGAPGHPSGISTRREFADALRALKDKRKELSYAYLTAEAYKLQKRSDGLRFKPQDLARSTVSEWLAATRLPSRDKLQTFLTICEVPADMFPAWLDALDRVGRAADPRDSPGETGQPGPAGGTPSWARSRAILIAVLVLAVIGVAAVLVMLSMNPGDLEPPGRTIVVQNKVAIGPNGLTEDRTPAYLSLETRSRCEERGCKIEGTDLDSGDVVTASCYVRSEMLYNYNLDSSEVAQNPYKFESDLWYRAEHPNGAVGFLSEIWVEPAYRGGLNLPLCPPA